MKGEANQMRVSALSVSDQFAILVIFKRKNMEYVPERNNPHHFWIVYCIISG